MKCGSLQENYSLRDHGRRLIDDSAQVTQESGDTEVMRHRGQKKVGCDTIRLNTLQPALSNGKRQRCLLSLDYCAPVQLR